MLYSKEIISNILNKIDLVALVERYAEVVPNSQGHRCLCFFHDDTTPSMQIYDRCRFRCYACGESGNAINILRKVKGVGFKEAVAILAEEAGIPLEESSGTPHKNDAGHSKLSRASYTQILSDAHRYYQTSLASEDGANCREYLNQRNISEEMQKTFALAYAPKQGWALRDALRCKGWSIDQGLETRVLCRSKNSGRVFDLFRDRLIFPINDASGELIAFGGRALSSEENAKYVNSPETPYFKKSRTLYGLDLAKASISKTKKALVSEGYLDVVMLHQHGFTNSVAALGTAFGLAHGQTLSRFCGELDLLFDGDPAGRTAAFKAATIATQLGLTSKVVLFPSGHDADSFLREYGPRELEYLIETATEGLRYCVEQVSALSPMECVLWVQSFFQGISSPLLRAHYVPRIAEAFGLSEFELRRWEELAEEQEEPAKENPTVNSDFDLLRGFVLRPEYLLIFKNRNIPFQDESFKLIFEKLAEAGTVDRAIPLLNKDEYKLVKECMRDKESITPEYVLDWYVKVRDCVNANTNHPD